MIPIFVSTSQFDNDNLISANELAGLALRPTFNPTGRRLTEDEISHFLSQGFVGLIAGLEPLTSGVLKSATALRVIARVGTGLDTVDTTCAANLGIAVVNTPNATTDAVAELTLGHILSALRGIARADRQMRNGQWIPYMGRLLKDKTVGVIGFGRIGQRVAQLVEAFGANVLLHDITLTSQTDGRWRELLNLCAEADVISIHTPLVDDTRNLIGTREIKTMKHGAILVNVARGGIVDEEALIHALRDGHIFAAIDCFAREPYSGDLTSLDNVSFTPHMGSYAKETRAMMEQEAAMNLVKELLRLRIL